MTGPGARTVRRVLAAAAGLALLWVATSACAGGPPTVAPSGVDGLTIPTPSPDPGDFVDQVDNRWFPLRPGTTWTYRTTGDPGDLVRVVRVADGTREVAGVATTVVRQTTRTAGGHLVERGEDWYAQDTAGNVWAFGERTTSYDHERRDDRDWQAGVDGAEAGLVMAATPRLGDGYAMERRPGVAEDRATVLSVIEQRTVPLGEYGDLVELEVTSPLHPGVAEHRYYAPGVGLVYAELATGGNESDQLVATTRG